DYDTQQWARFPTLVRRARRHLRHLLRRFRAVPARPTSQPIREGICSDRESGRQFWADLLRWRRSTASNGDALRLDWRAHLSERGVGPSRPPAALPTPAAHFGAR